MEREKLEGGGTVVTGTPSVTLPGGAKVSKPAAKERKSTYNPYEESDELKELKEIPLSQWWEK